MLRIERRLPSGEIRSTRWVKTLGVVLFLLLAFPAGATLPVGVSPTCMDEIWCKRTGGPCLHCVDTAAGSGYMTCATALPAAHNIAELNIRRQGLYNCCINHAVSCSQPFQVMDPNTGGGNPALWCPGGAATATSTATATCTPHDTPLPDGSHGIRRYWGTAPPDCDKFNIICDPGYHQSTSPTCAPNTASQSSTATATASTSTATSSPTMTATATYSSTATATIPSTSTATTATSTTSTSTSIYTSTETAVDQGQAQEDAAAEAQKKAEEAAANGAIGYAEAILQVGTNPAEAGVLLDAAQQALDAAEELKRLELIALKNAAAGGANKDWKVAAVRLDEAGIKSAVAISILDELEKKYGISKKEFLSTITGIKKDPDRISELLGGKLSREQISKAIEAAANLTEEERKKILEESRAAEAGRESVYSMSGKSAKKVGAAPTSSLRDTLKKRLEEKTDQVPTSNHRAYSSGKANTAAKKSLGGEALAPLENAFQGELAAQGDGLTLFDVVRRKYREKSPMLRPWDN